MDRVTLDMVNLADVFKDLDKLDVKIQLHWLFMMVLLQRVQVTSILF
jgi:hypothetical protein